MNKTQVAVFEFSGLTEDKELVPFLFFFFMLVYMVTMAGNAGMIGVLNIYSRLHAPMYFFLNYLSIVDIMYASNITPKMLFDLVSAKKLISFVGCAVQFFIYASLASSEVFLLSSMAYDRYAAICHPLQYVFIMTQRKCWCLVLFSFGVGFLQAFVPTGCVFTLQFCGSNLIDHYYCDIPPVIKLSCSDPLFCNVLTNICVCFCTFSSLMTILVSYMLIIPAILRINTSKGRQKAFSTCSSHLICVTLFYVTVFLNYFRPTSGSLDKQSKAASVFYSLMTPMLNPLIYSLRNQEVKRIIMRTIKRQK
ncbi:olfactory receptor 5AP2-like [Gastrophryne carolinensis]